MLSNRLSVLEETLINDKGFCALVCRSVELTFKPQGACPDKNISLANLYQ